MPSGTVFILFKMVNLVQSYNNLKWKGEEGGYFRADLIDYAFDRSVSAYFSSDRFSPPREAPKQSTSREHNREEPRKAKPAPALDFKWVPAGTLLRVILTQRFPCVNLTAVNYLGQFKSRLKVTFIETESNRDSLTILTFIPHLVHSWKRRRISRMAKRRTSHSKKPSRSEGKLRTICRFCL